MGGRGEVQSLRESVYNEVAQQPRARWGPPKLGLKGVARRGKDSRAGTLGRAAGAITAPLHQRCCRDG